MVLLRRMLGFARPYVAMIALSVVIILVYSGGRYARALWGERCRRPPAIFWIRSKKIRVANPARRAPCTRGALPERPAGVKQRRLGLYHRSVAFDLGLTPAQRHYPRTYQAAVIRPPLPAR